MQLTVVTLWRRDWNSVQGAILRQLMQEQLPARTHFIWTAPHDSNAESQLEASWFEFEQPTSRYSAELLTVPNVEIPSAAAKHYVVATLYDEVVADVRGELTLFIEDDVLFPSGGVKRLLSAFERLPENAAGLMGIYRSRMQPQSVCASDLNGRYVGWPAPRRKELMEVSWMGGGFTLYRTASLRRSRPFRANGTIGWDVNLCRSLRQNGERLFVHLGIRGQHLCHEVRNHCDRVQESIA